MTLTKWNKPFEVLRKKWGEVPAGRVKRVTTQSLLDLSDEELLADWMGRREEATTGEYFAVRGWYHTLYKDVFRGKKVMDVGSGLGMDGLTFAQYGANMTFVDIVESNLEILKRLSKILKLENVEFCYMEDLDSISFLPNNYDVIWCQGSLINTPFEVTKEEVEKLLIHLPIGGRWIELAYPKERWEREGKLPFDQWGECTDGEGTPWIEWYDLDKLRELLNPAEFEVVLYLNFFHDDFNWFDLERTK